jgi:uncharacterized protein YjbI with pentapeptide repeats
MIDKDNFGEVFENLVLSGQELLQVEFEDCVFRYGDFSQVSFKQCYFSECHFVHCDMSLMQVMDSRFTGCKFEDCKVIGVDWTKADWSGLTQVAPQFNHCVLNDSSFWGLKLESIMIHACDARDVDFREANLHAGDCGHTDFSQSLFRNSRLTEVDFSHARSFDIDVRVNDIKGAKFSRYEALRLLDGLDIVLVD